MKFPHSHYPAELADDVEITPQREAGREVWVVGRAATGRYIKLGANERRVLELVGGRAAGEIAAEFAARHGGTLSPATVVKFLSTLGALGLLAGEGLRQGQSAPLTRHVYLRFSLFDPDALFGFLVPKLGWVWTPAFVVVTLLLMLLVGVMTLNNGAEVAHHAGRILAEDFFLVLLAALVVVFSHEFAHGLTCKAFGGRATEVGLLLIYYCLPALYCNVSGIHRIAKRSRRLWVIAAGVYWQFLVGALSMLAWFMLEPYTLPADAAMIFALGSLLNVAFNANPLIKLDGYYFLSQLLYLPNLMEKSREYWRNLLSRMTFGEWRRMKLTAKQRAAYFAFGPLSLGYTIALTFVMLRFLNELLVGQFNLFGYGLTGLAAAVLMRRPLKQSLHSISTALLKKNAPAAPTAGQPTLSAAPPQTALQPVPPQKPAAKPAAHSDAAKSEVHTPPKWKRRTFFAVAAAVIVAVLCFPWDATVGSYGTLTPLKEREAVVTAPEGGIVTVLVKPGERVNAGREIARLSNPDLTSELIGVRAELAKAQAEFERLAGELRAGEQAVERAAVQAGEAARRDSELQAEQRQILARKLNPESNDFPAALSVLQADVDLKRSRVAEAENQLARTLKLYNDKLIARSEYETVENRAVALRLELEAAREKLSAAIVEHRREAERTGGELRVSQAELQMARSTVAKTTTELGAARALLDALRQKEQVLEAKRTSVVLTAPRDGVVFGERLPDLAGKYVEKGAELCRVADTSEMRVVIQVPEREIGDVREGSLVRLKTRAWPDRVFRGHVGKIGGESELDENKQATYRVELVVDNSDGALKPGMTAFARIHFGRKMVGALIWHKVKQALRPELWMI
jgi:putative peptide zinc metalloprotease protein